MNPYRIQKLEKGEENDINYVSILIIFGVVNVLLIIGILLFSTNLRLREDSNTEESQEEIICKSSIIKFISTKTECEPNQELFFDPTSNIIIC